MRFLKRYGHGLIIVIYGVVYMILFTMLESRNTGNYHVVISPLDNRIPFCEAFVIPYLLWFPFVLWTVLYFIFVSRRREEYYRLVYNMMFGMTVFLAVSFTYPNMQILRPMTLPRDNFCSDMVKFIYSVDTPTNVLPSMHVYIAIAACVALVECEGVKMLKHCNSVRVGILILTVLIILSTVLIKQHSIVDVIAGCVLAVMSHAMFYYVDFTEIEPLSVKEDVC